MTGKRASAIGALCALALAAAAATAIAAAGQLDSSFSNDGKRTVTFGAGTDEGKGVAFSDGRIVVAGSSDQGATGNDFAVARLMPGGGLDANFSGDGRRTVTFGSGSTNDIGSAVAIQANGRIVVAGESNQTGTGTNFAIARLMPNGALDQSFAGDGKRSISFGNGVDTDRAEAVLIQPDGRIVVVGDSDQANTTGTGNDFAVARLMPNGRLDQSFSGDGKRLIAFPAPGFDVAQGVAIQGNGRVVVSGTSDGDFAVVRLLPGGGLDQSFSADGKRIVAFGDEGDDVAIQANGRIVVAGALGEDFALIRLLAGGGLDQSFSGDGKRLIGFGTGTSDEGDDLAIQGDGRILVTGTSDQGPPTETDFAIARVNSNGSLDTGFSGDGKRTVSFSTGPDEVDETGDDVAIQPNGRIVMMGHASQGATGVDFAIARFLAN